MLLLDVKIYEDINSPSTSCTAARLLVESRRLKLKPLFIFLKEGQAPKSEKIPNCRIESFAIKIQDSKIFNAWRTEQLSVCNWWGASARADPIVNFQLTAHSPNPGTHNFEHSNYFGHPRGNFLARLIFSTQPYLEQKHNTSWH